MDFISGRSGFMDCSPIFLFRKPESRLVLLDSGQMIK